MLNRNIFFGLLLFMVVVSAAARAYVAQDYGTAMSFGNYQRDVDDNQNKSFSASTNSDSKYDRSNVDGVVDNQAIAAKIFAGSNKNRKNENKPYIYDFSNYAAKNIVVPIGASVFFVLPEEEGTIWHVDCSNEKVFKALSSQKNGSDRILEFEAGQLGFARIYMDNMDKRTTPIKTIKSIIVKVKVS